MPPGISRLTASATRSRDMERIVASAALAGMLALSAGCLISSSSRTQTSGHYISPSTMNQVEKGARQDFVIATLGEPSKKIPMDDGSELWKWEWRQVRESEGALFLVFSGENSTEKNGAAYVLMRDGVVEKAWRE
jgi:hypothetical protein